MIISRVGSQLISFSIDTQTASDIIEYIAAAHNPQMKKAITKERLTGRGLISPMDYYLEKHALNLN